MPIIPCTNVTAKAASGNQNTAAMIRTCGTRKCETCETCDGSGNATCDNRGCEDAAVGFDEDGNALCEDCLMEAAMGDFGP